MKVLHLFWAALCLLLLVSGSAAGKVTSSKDCVNLKGTCEHRKCSSAMIEIGKCNARKNCCKV
ncbi:beta-defensin 130B [Zootoca vivipara]|uniref:beta-defensin 130B n=1 Tax=Zootoca vivipara TaxID=8524 RepID=UPI00293BEA71|nr:beta-defensin 130B [Zootoca vivipara]